MPVWPRAVIIRSVLGAALFIGCVATQACAPTQLLRDDLPARCELPDLRAQMRLARDSLVLQPYLPHTIYDLDANARVVPFHANPLAPDALAVLSYPDPGHFAGGGRDFARLAHRSFLYDNALAALWLVHDGDLTRARRILATMAALQRLDGAWGFGFNAGDDDGYYNAAYVRTGAVAWAIYALAHYRSISHDTQFDGTLRHATLWLLGQRDAQTGLFYAGSGRWIDATHFSPQWPAYFFATEHQLDTWFALQAVALAWPEFATQQHLTVVLAGLAAGLNRSLWLPTDRRFAQGMADGRVDTQSALDSAGTWSALWLLTRGDGVRAEQALGWVTAQHTVLTSGWRGSRPYRDAPPKTWFVEASIAQPLAHWRMGQIEIAQQMWQPLAQLACMGGLPLVYAPDWHPDFPLSPATAPTVWFLIAGQEIVEGGKPWLWAEL